MISLFVLPILILLVGFTIYNIKKNRRRNNKVFLEKTMTFDPTAETVQMQPQASSPINSFEDDSCKLALTLRIVGVINIIAAVILCFVFAEDLGWFSSLVVIISGILSCLFWYALAKCVDAADKYLKSH